jgi:hypothetical protein
MILRIFLNASPTSSSSSFSLLILSAAPINQSITSTGILILDFHLNEVTSVPVLVIDV